MTLQTIAQLIMLATLILMITGRTPIYMTAITGAAISLSLIHISEPTRP